MVVFNLQLRRALLLVTLLALAACVSASDKQYRLLEQSLKQGDIDAAFDHAVASLHDDIGNTKTLNILPQVAAQAYAAAESKARMHAGAKQWDQSAARYQRIEQMKMQILQIRTQLTAALVAEQGASGRLSTLAAAIDAIKAPQIGGAFAQVKQMAAREHYRQGELLAAQHDYRVAALQFERAGQYVLGYKQADKLAYRYNHLAAEADAAMHYRLGEEASGKHAYRQAFEQFSDAVKFIPDYRDARAKAEQYKRLADQQDAEQFYAQGEDLAAQQRYRAAAGAFARSEEFLPGFRDAARLHRHYSRMANEVDAADRYRQGMRMLDDDDFAGAARAFREADRLIPGFRDALAQAHWAEQAMPPDDFEVIRLVRREIAEHGIPPRWFGPRIDADDLVSTKSGVIRVAHRGEFRRRAQAWHYTIYIEFSGVIRIHDTPQPVAGSVHQGFTLFRERDGDWEARLSRPFEKLT